MLDAGEATDIAVAIDGHIANLVDETRGAAVRSVIRSLLQHVFVAALIEQGGVLSDPRHHGALVMDLPSERVDALAMLEAEAKRWGVESALRGVFVGSEGEKAD